MSKWEYMFIQQVNGSLEGGTIHFVLPNGERKKSGPDVDGTFVIKLLNYFGELGWEVAGVGTISSSNRLNNSITWTLKRPKE